MLRPGRESARPGRLVFDADPETAPTDPIEIYRLAKKQWRSLLATKPIFAYTSWDEPILTLDKLNDLSNHT